MRTAILPGDSPVDWHDFYRRENSMPQEPGDRILVAESQKQTTIAVDGDQRFVK
jgi:PIN domain nuclease of toxin-antitoxin system